MPPAFDRKPMKRSDKDPTQVLDFNDLDATINAAGNNIRVGIPGIIYQLTGIDVSSWEAFMTSLNDGVGIDLPNVNAMLKQLVDIFNNLVVTPINTAIQGVKDWWDGLWSFRDKTETTQFNLENFQIGVLTSGYRNPAWVCRYPIADVTYPEFYHTNTPLFGDTDTASGHTHSFSYPAAFSGVPYSECDQNDSMGGYVCVASSTVFDTVGMVLRKISSGSINNVFIEVFRETEAGGLERLESHDVASSLTTTTTYIEVPINGIIAQAGERYVVRARNSSSAANKVGVTGVLQANFSYDYSMHTAGSTNTSKTTITDAEAATFRAASSFLPFALLAAKNLAATDRSWTDNFNRSALGGLWSPKSNTGSDQLRISDRKLAYTGLTEGHQNAIHIMPMSGDANLIEGDLSLNILGGFRRLGLLMHCNRDLSQVVYLGVNGDDSKIYSGSITSMTERASDTDGGSGRWGMFYDETNDKYVVMKGGNATGLEWTGVGSAVQHGKDFRYGGGRITLDDVIMAGYIDNITYRDWVPV